MFKNYYEILNISRSADNKTIKLAFKAQVKKWHPDKNPNRDTTIQMQNINEARLILLDTEARQRYDIEYQRFQSFTNKQPTNPTLNTEDERHYRVEDEVLERWIKNANDQSVSLAKRTMQELSGMTIAAAEAVGTTIKDYFIFSFGCGAFVLIVMVVISIIGAIASIF